MKTLIKKETEKMKSKRPHWKHQGKDDTNSKGNYTISAIPDIYPMTVQRIIGKEATSATTTKTVTATIKK